MLVATTMEEDNTVIDDDGLSWRVFTSRDEANLANNVTRVISVICFGKYLLTDIFYDLCFQSRNICRQIFQNGYFSLLYVICLQRLQKTEKLVTENRYSKKKRWSVSHRGRYDTDGLSETQKKNPFSVFCRTKTQP